MIPVSQLDYIYPAIVTRVRDGDTIVVRMEKYAGSRGWAVVDCELRLHGIDAPSTKGETKVAGEASKAFLSNLVMGKKITYTTFKDKKDIYGRFISIVYIEGLEGKLNDWMVTNGHAVYHRYALGEKPE